MTNDDDTDALAKALDVAATLQAPHASLMFRAAARLRTLKMALALSKKAADEWKETALEYAVRPAASEESVWR